MRVMLGSCQEGVSQSIYFVAHHLPPHSRTQTPACCPALPQEESSPSGGQGAGWRGRGSLLG